ncbi:TetR/AcrR family transcriptional regulator [Jiangella alkaliphila]|uniref:Regulatory protein, tetR family n=1 Tax=Jiangella alkaliphila TaxID=419479 RepID=A0A1H2KW25_9ACTN|nr:TetR/AcrR family transcriptional regulator [Jiangella alkaliphila]SDU72903.1 regulatory protein, tetR family [Jiangella alkaliphila]
MTDDHGRPMRADARRNRARVLHAAEVVLARDGLEAPMNTIAREAGVGVGTIYRQFPTKETLYQAIVAARQRRMIDEATALATADDPGAALFGYFVRVIDEARTKKTFAEALADAGIDIEAGSDDIHAEMLRANETLLTRARRAGAVRDDLTMPELMALLTGASLAAQHGGWDDGLRDRTLAIIFDGMRPHH